MTPYQPINVPQWGSCVDFNIFTNRKALEQAQANNTDSHSIIANVVFENPAAGDYTVNKDCHDVFRLGFHNIAMNDFGVVSPHLKQIAKRPEMSLPVILDGQNDANMTSWQGWNIKNLETLGERSATGMDSEHGVYVISIAVFNNPLRDYIKANDVILEFDNKTVDSLRDLFEAEKQLAQGRPVEITLFRNQNKHVITVPYSAFQ